MNNQFMVDPISELGRGVMKATGDMSPEQKAAYAQQAQMMGIAPQQALETMMAQQQQLRNFKPQQPPMPTVRDKLAQAAMQMQQGLGAIPTGVLNNASYAGGGIVAFQNGGAAADPSAGIAELGRETARKQLLEMIAQAEQAGQFNRATVLRGQLRRMLTGSETSMVPKNEGLYEASGAKLSAGLSAPIEQDMVEAISKGPSARRGPAVLAAEKERRKKENRGDQVASPRVVAPPPAVPTDAAQEGPNGYAARLAEIRKLQEEQGIGGASSALAALLDKEEAEGKKQAAQDRRMALAQAGFAMAEAAGRPGAKFLGAASAAGQSYVTGRAAADKAARDYQRTIARERINLQRADEALKMGNINLAIQLQGQSEERAAKAKETASRNALAYYTANLEATLGRERTDAVLRGQRLDTMLKISEQTADELGSLAMNPEYLKAKPEDQVRMRNAIMEKGNKMVANMLGAGALGDTKKLSGGIKFLGFED